MWHELEYLEIKVKAPKSPSKIIKFEDNVLLVQISKAPENGLANQELIKLLKKETKSEYKIISGFTSKKKRVKKI